MSFTVRCRNEQKMTSGIDRQLTIWFYHTVDGSEYHAVAWYTFRHSNNLVLIGKDCHICSFITFGKILSMEDLPKSRKETDKGQKAFFKVTSIKFRIPHSAFRI